ncbi:MAG: hypothetical protein JWO87_3838, partial [Phycisphaerales bacterium]|nr:hypothetical protein [Phycisphaerales bacterium]
MPSMLRRLFTLLSALSLLLCVATSALWVRSCFKPFVLPFRQQDESCRATLVSGRLSIDNAPAVAAEMADLERDRAVVLAI